MLEVNASYISPANRPQPSLADIKRSDDLMIATTGAPGATDLVTSPGKMKVALQRIEEGHSGYDPRQVMRNVFSLISSASAAVYSFFTLGSFFSTGCATFSYVFTGLERNLTKVATVSQAIFGHPAVIALTSGLGTLVSAINATFETLGLYKQIKFRKHFNLSETVTNKNAAEKFEAFVKYLGLTEKQSLALAKKGKMQFVGTSKGFDINAEDLDRTRSLFHNARLYRLSEIISPWLAIEIDSELCQMHTKLGTEENDKAVKWLNEIYQLMDVQSKKALIVHSLGLAAIATGVLATVLSFAIVPAALPLFLLLAILSTGFALARYAIHAGYFNSRGWKFIPVNLIPVSLREIPQKVIKAINETEDVAFSSNLLYDPIGYAAGNPIPA